MQFQNMYKLNKILKYAYEHVPYYRRIFDERDIKPQDIDSIDALAKIPLLTKDTIREARTLEILVCLADSSGRR